MIFIKNVSALNPTLQKCDVDLRACIAREAAQEQGIPSEAVLVDFPTRLNQRAQVSQLLDWAYALRTHPTEWQQFLQNRSASLDLNLEPNSALLFTLWLADYCGVLSLVSSEPFLVLSGLHRTVRKYGVRVESFHDQRSDLKTIKQVWERLGSPCVPGLVTDLREFFNGACSRRLRPLVADLLYQFGFPVQSLDGRHYTIIIDELLDNCCIAAAFEHDSEIPVRDKIGRLYPDLQPLFLARFRLRSHQPIML